MRFAVFPVLEEIGWLLQKLEKLYGNYVLHEILCRNNGKITKYDFHVVYIFRVASLFFLGGGWGVISAAKNVDWL